MDKPQTLDSLRSKLKARTNAISDMDKALESFHSLGLDVGKPALYKDIPVFITGFKVAWNSTMSVFESFVYIATQYGQPSESVETNQSYYYITVQSTWVPLSDVKPFSTASKILYGDKGEN